MCSNRDFLRNHLLHWCVCVWGGAVLMRRQSCAEVHVSMMCRRQSSPSGRKGGRWKPLPAGRASHTEVQPEASTWSLPGNCNQCMCSHMTAAGRCQAGRKDGRRHQSSPSHGRRTRSRTWENQDAAPTLTRWHVVIFYACYQECEKREWGLSHQHSSL